MQLTDTGGEVVDGGDIVNNHASQHNRKLIKQSKNLVMESSIPRSVKSPNTERMISPSMANHKSISAITGHAHHVGGNHHQTTAHFRK